MWAPYTCVCVMDASRSEDSNASAPETYVGLLHSVCILEITYLRGTARGDCTLPQDCSTCICMRRLQQHQQQQLPRET